MREHGATAVQTVRLENSNGSKKNAFKTVCGLLFDKKITRLIPALYIADVDGSNGIPFAWLGGSPNNGGQPRFLVEQRKMVKSLIQGLAASRFSEN